MEENDLQKRLFKFAVDVIRAVRKLPKGSDNLIIWRQLIKSSTSSGANYNEAQAAVSKADFTNKVGISLKEMRESNYWIRIIIEVFEDNQEWITLDKESQELMNILGSIYSKTSTHR
jgi:four helix bundle protein